MSPDAPEGAADRAARSNIALIGMAYAGKSTVGPWLARSLLLDFLDTDLLIQATARRPLQALVDQLGREGFLALEEATVAGLACTGKVIATGGSVIYGERAMAHLRTIARVVYLEVPLPVLLRRVHDSGTRGLVTRPGMTFEDLFREREPLYRRWAEVTVPCAEDGPEAVVGWARALLGHQGEAARETDADGPAHG